MFKLAAYRSLSPYLVARFSCLCFIFSGMVWLVLVGQTLNKWVDCLFYLFFIRFLFASFRPRLFLLSFLPFSCYPFIRLTSVGIFSLLCIILFFIMRIMISSNSCISSSIVVFIVFIGSDLTIPPCLSCYIKIRKNICIGTTKKCIIVTHIVQFTVMIRISYIIT